MTCERKEALIGLFDKKQKSHLNILLVWLLTDLIQIKGKKRLFLV